MKILQQDFLTELENNSNISEKVNASNKQKILEMTKVHSEKITELYFLKDDHWVIETADLIILCFQLLLNENKDINSVFEKGIPRFYKKLDEIRKQNQRATPLFRVEHVFMSTFSYTRNKT